MKKFNFLNNFLFETNDNELIKKYEYVYSVRMTPHDTLEQYSIERILVDDNFIYDDFNYNYYSQLHHANQWRNLFIAWDKVINENQELVNSINNLTDIINEHERR
jgi:hypothetical protein